MRRMLLSLSPRHWRQAVTLAVLTSLASTPTRLPGAEVPRPAAGEVQLAAGRTAGYTLHFDRNSLRDCLRQGDALVTLTSSGALVRFELEGTSVRWTRDRIDRAEATCLGRGEGDAILAGFADGRVCRVDPTTLDLTDVVKLSAPPCWIGWRPAIENRPASLVVVLRPTKQVVSKGVHWDVPYSLIQDLATEKSFTRDEEATAFLLDRAGRLWLGYDKGEWGGGVTKIDLVGGTAETIKPPPPRKPDREAYWSGVYGFVEQSDGQVWAYGGTSHMGSNHGFVARVDVANPQVVFAFEPSFDPDRKPDPNRPDMPITHINREGDGLCVFSYSDVFHTDKGLKTWKRAATLDLAYRWGRPDAVGAYPSVNAVLPPRRQDEPYVLATVGDGLVVLDRGKATSHALPGQLGASDVTRVVNSSEGSLILDGSDGTPAWRLGAKGWEVADFSPAFESAPELDDDIRGFEKDDGDWSETCILVGPNGSILTVNGSSMSDGTRTTARWVAGKAIRLGREVASFAPELSFVTADGALWNAYYDGLRRFQEGRWRLVERKRERPNGNDQPLDPILSLNSDGPPWVLLDRRQQTLWRLDHGSAGADARLERLTVEEDGTRLQVADSVLEPDGSLLLAANVGLRRYTPGTRRLAKTELPEPPKPASTLVRDGLGRLWVGNQQGFWVLDVGAPAFESLDPVPGMNQGRIQALAPDPRRADAVIVALGSHGVAFVQVEPLKKKP